MGDPFLVPQTSCKDCKQTGDRKVQTLVVATDGGRVRLGHSTPRGQKKVRPPYRSTTSEVGSLTKDHGGSNRRF